MTQGGLRKKPLQERSRATIQRILDTASTLLVEVGYDAVTASPTLLLQESGVSRGSFYSFFETPEKVLDELAFQCMQESAVLLDDMLQAAPTTHWNGVVDTLVTFYIDCFKRPLVRELWVGQNLTPPVRAADRAWMEEVAGRLFSALQDFAPSFEQLSMRQCLVAIEICERLFQFAYTEDVDGDQHLVEEIRIVLTEYLSHYSAAVKPERTEQPRRRKPVPARARK